MVEGTLDIREEVSWSMEDMDGNAVFFTQIFRFFVDGHLCSGSQCAQNCTVDRSSVLLNYSWVEINLLHVQP